MVSALAKAVPARAIRWTRPGQIHVTLNFFGRAEAARIPEIKAALRAACAGHRGHTVGVEELGCFPHLSRPQILWAGLSGNLLPLQNLKSSLDTALLPCGYIAEERPFHPHLTIGRTLRLNSAGRRKIAEVLANDKGHKFGEWHINRVDLMQSVLSPEGASYSTLESILLEN